MLGRFGRWLAPLATMTLAAPLSCGSSPTTTAGEPETVQQPITGATDVPANDPLGQQTAFVLRTGQTGTLLTPWWVLIVGGVDDGGPFEVQDTTGTRAFGTLGWGHPTLGLTLVHLDRGIGSGRWVPIAATDPAVGQLLSVYGYGSRLLDIPSIGPLGTCTVAVSEVTGEPNSSGTLQHADANLFTVVPLASSQRLPTNTDTGAPLFDTSGALRGVHLATTIPRPFTRHFTPTRRGFEIKSSQFRDWALRTMVRPPNDFDGDGAADILWHNETTGELQAWEVRGSNVVAREALNARFEGQPVVAFADPWYPVGSNDFNHDGMTDVLWHNTSNLQTQIWYMSGVGRFARDTIHNLDGTVPLEGAPWFIVGTSDFDRDGSTDILWHNDDSGETQVWYLNGATVRYTQTVLADDSGAAYVGWPWHIVGTNKFNDDDYADILWHNEDTGESQIWYLQGTNGSRVGYRRNVTAGGTNANAGPPWRIVGTNDFGSSAKPDILWHNDDTNETLVWYMDDYRRTNQSTISASDGGSATVGSPWKVVNH